MEQNAEQAYANLLAYATTLHAENKTAREVQEALKEKGLTEELSATITDQSYQLYTGLLLKKANKNITWGAVWFVGGLVVTLVTMSGGGRYVLCYGAIIGGMAQLISGLVQRSKLS